MPSDFRMRVYHMPTDTYVEWEPGKTLELDLIEKLVERVAAKGVGVGRTTKHVSDDVRAAITELLYELKKQV